MIDCSALSDRMPDVVHGRAIWSEAETVHLATCDECAAEWRLVRAGLALQAGLAIRADTVAEVVTAGLRESPSEPVAVRRLPWRSALVATMSMAAAVALVIGLPQHRVSTAAAIPDSAPVASAVLPELNSLTEGELESVLHSLDSSTEDAPSEALPRLGDLDEGQLEQLLRSVEG